MAIAQVNHFFGLSQYRGARGWTCRKHCFSSLRYDPGESNPTYQLWWRMLKQHVSLIY